MQCNGRDQQRCSSHLPASDQHRGGQTLQKVTAHEGLFVLLDFIKWRSLVCWPAIAVVTNHRLGHNLAGNERRLVKSKQQIWNIVNYTNT